MRAGCVARLSGSAVFRTSPHDAYPAHEVAPVVTVETTGGDEKALARGSARPHA